MARIAGVNVPTEKHIAISLTHIYGIGRPTALEICKKLDINPATKAKELSEDEVARLRTEIDKSYSVEGDLRRTVAANIKRLRDIKCYRGRRHMLGLPVRGQDTKRNARTRKGKKKPIRR